MLGRFVPIDDVDSEKGKCSDYVDTEEFIEDFHPIDISFELALECEVTQDGFRPKLLADMLKMNIPLFPKKRLHFKIQYCNVPEPYTLLWKVLNRGKKLKSAIVFEVKLSTEKNEMVTSNTHNLKVSIMLSAMW